MGWTDVATLGVLMNIEHEIKAIQRESEDTKNLPLPEEIQGERRGRSVVRSVRLPESEFQEIEQLATELGVPISALIRGWVLQGLAEERGISLRSAIERVASEADRLRRIANKHNLA